MTLLVAAVAALPTTGRAQAETVAPSLSRADLGKLVEALRGVPERPLKVRLQAALILGRVGDFDAVDALADCLARDPEYAVRGACALALGNVGDPRAIEPLAAGLDDVEEVVRRETGKSLARLARPEALPYLQAVREHGSVRVREGLVDLLVAIKVPEAAQVLVELVGDSDPQVQRRAEAALAAMEPGAANALLLAGLGHPSYRVRERAAVLLGKRRAAEAVERLLELATAPLEAAEVQRAARAGLREMRRLLDLPKIADRARALTGERAERHRALVLLAAAGGPEALQACLDVLADPQESMRGLAAQALADLGDPRALGSLREAMNRPENARVAKVIQVSIRKLER